MRASATVRVLLLLAVVVTFETTRARADTSQRFHVAFRSGERRADLGVVGAVCHGRAPSQLGGSVEGKCVSKSTMKDDCIQPLMSKDCDKTNEVCCVPAMSKEEFEADFKKRSALKFVAPVDTPGESDADYNKLVFDRMPSCSQLSFSASVSSYGFWKSQEFGAVIVPFPKQKQAQEFGFGDFLFNYDKPLGREGLVTFLKTPISNQEFRCFKDSGIRPPKKEGSDERSELLRQHGIIFQFRFMYNQWLPKQPTLKDVRRVLDHFIEAYHTEDPFQFKARNGKKLVLAGAWDSKIPSKTFKVDVTGSSEKKDLVVQPIMPQLKTDSKFSGIVINWAVISGTNEYGGCNCDQAFSLVKSKEEGKVSFLSELLRMGKATGSKIFPLKIGSVQDSGGAIWDERGRGMLGLATYNIPVGCSYITLIRLQFADQEGFLAPSTAPKLPSDALDRAIKWVEGKLIETFLPIANLENDLGEKARAELFLKKTVPKTSSGEVCHGRIPSQLGGTMEGKCVSKSEMKDECIQPLQSKDCAKTEVCCVQHQPVW